MNIHKSLLSVIFILGATANICKAETTITKEKIKSIINEVQQATMEKDFKGSTKYVYPGSVIYIDMDPAPNKGETKIPYNDYMKLSKIGLQEIDNMDLTHQVLNIEVATDGKSASVEIKTMSSFDMMGMKVEDESLSKIKYGIVEGKIMVLEQRDTIISSSMSQ